MKKLMIAAAIVCAAAMVQASQVKWNLTGVTAKGSTKPTNYTAYFFLASDSSESTPTSKIIDLATAEAYAAAGNFAALEAASMLTAKIQSNGSVTTSLTPDNTSWVRNTEIQSFAIVLNNDVPGNATYYAVALDTDYDPAVYYETAFNSDTAKPTAYLQQSGDWSAVSAVPEPTSGLLLLLGVAGLALRRRRA